MISTPMLDIAAAKERFLTTDELAKALAELHRLGGGDPRYVHADVSVGRHGAGIHIYGRQIGSGATIDDALVDARATIGKHMEDQD